MRPTWVEVSLPALRKNFRITKDFVGPDVTVCAVVKADAYGHGATECARALEREGAAWFGVTSTEEGVRLREGGVGGRVLLMTGFWRGDQDAVIAQRLTPAVWQRESLELLNTAARRLGVQRVPVHVKLDTGMARLGVPLAELDSFLQALRECRHVALEGLFTHLASAEVVDADDVEQQAERFQNALTKVRQAGLEPRLVHAANSAAIAARRALHFNFVRPGLSLYGYYLPFISSSGRPVETRGLDVRPVLAWKTRIISLRDVPAGQPIGYGGAFVTEAPARIAVLPLGYADGVNRHLSSLGRVIVRGAYAPIVGNVSMDITIVDVQHIPEAAIGDEVVLFGEQGNCRIDAWEHATHAQTVPYEILCGISRRVPRKYV